jgi:MOSC domain-containing protein YiiM
MAVMDRPRAQTDDTRVTSGTVHAIHVSRGGVPKQPVLFARITTAGVEGDRQRNLRIHGGPDRAVSLYSLDLIEVLRIEGHPIAPGSTGENLTIADLEWSTVVPGARLSVGEARLEITSYAQPCPNISASFLEAQIGRISMKLHPGWSRVYARVLREGIVRAGDAVELHQRDTLPGGA